MSKKKYPVYGEQKGVKPGLYLGLFHGFKNAKARDAAQDWGAPIVQVLEHVS